MTVQLTKYQYEQIVALSKNDDNIDDVNKSFINNSRPMAGVYAYILSLISKNNDPGQGPAVGVDHGIWQWFRAAKDINNGGGVFSAFIREYTAEQRRIRLGEETSISEMNAASDSIGRGIIKSIANQQYKLVTLKQIGQEDAGAIGENIFRKSNRPLAGWSGNVLFPLLGESEFLQKNILDDSQDAYDLFALLHSAQYAAVQAAAGMNDLNDAVNFFSVIFSILRGNARTVSPENVATDTMELRKFLEKNMVKI